MSLDWKIDTIENYLEVCWVPDPKRPGKKTLNPVTDALIWTTMAVDIGQITEENHEKWFKRLLAWELAVHGERYEVWHPDGSVRPITLEDVHQHVGLRTNVFPQDFPAADYERNEDYFMDQADKSSNDGGYSVDKSTLLRRLREDEYEVDEDGEQHVPVELMTGSDLDFQRKLGAVITDRVQRMLYDAEARANAVAQTAKQ